MCGGPNLDRRALMRRRRSGWGSCGGSFPDWGRLVCQVRWELAASCLRSFGPSWFARGWLGGQAASARAGRGSCGGRSCARRSTGRGRGHSGGRSSCRDGGRGSCGGGCGWRPRRGPSGGGVILAWRDGRGACSPPTRARSGQGRRRAPAAVAAGSGGPRRSRRAGDRRGSGRHRRSSPAPDSGGRRARSGAARSRPARAAPRAQPSPPRSVDLRTHVRVELERSDPAAALPGQEAPARAGPALVRKQRMQPLRSAGALTRECLSAAASGRAIAGSPPVATRARPPTAGRAPATARASAHPAGRSSADADDPAARSPTRIDQVHLEAMPLELARHPAPACRRLDRDRRQLPLPVHRPVAEPLARGLEPGTRSAHRCPDRAPPPGTPPCGYRCLRTTSAGASLRDGSWAANLLRLLEAPSTTSLRA